MQAVLESIYNGIFEEKKSMKYLYDKVREELDKVMMKTQNIDEIKKTLPWKVKLTRSDVVSVIKEMEDEGLYERHGDKLKKR